MMKVMALDYGDARTGVAISDPAGMLVGFTTVIAGDRTGRRRRTRSLRWYRRKSRSGW